MIACALCVGDTYEPYLEATLASIERVVDLLVVNNNAAQPRTANIATIEASTFAAQSRLLVIERPFVDFATMRNDAFAPLRERLTPRDWVLWMDADEVHGGQLLEVKRVLDQASADVAHVDAYTYHFYGTFRWFTDIARRMCAYRYSPELHWVNRVHERLHGLRGRAIVLPYVYHHYGNVRLPADFAARYRKYNELIPGDYEPPEPGTETVENAFAYRLDALRPFRGVHPAVARHVLARIEVEYAQAFSEMERTIARRFRSGVRAQVRNAAADAIEWIRVHGRRIEHPGLFPAPTTAR